jgi:hypothetical protein
VSRAAAANKEARFLSNAGGWFENREDVGTRRQEFKTGL